MAYNDDDAQETEFTLSPIKLLGLFFAVVVLCGIALAVGYNLGRTSARKEFAAVPAPAAQPAPATAAKPGAEQAAPSASQASPAQPAPETATADNKPPECLAGDCSHARPASATPAGAATAQPAPAQSGNGSMSFYKLKDKETHAPLTLPPPPAAAAAQQHATLGPGYSVQVAAVSNQDEAKRLRDQLMAQQYPVIITNPGDKLYHVQVGPYPEIKEAEVMKQRLVAAGWSTAFLKR
jgi:cell division septation protein DedD